MNLIGFADMVRGKIGQWIAKGRKGAVASFRKGIIYRHCWGFCQLSWVCYSYICGLCMKYLEIWKKIQPIGFKYLTFMPKLSSNKPFREAHYRCFSLI